MEEYIGKFWERYIRRWVEGRIKTFGKGGFESDGRLDKNVMELIMD